MRFPYKVKSFPDTQKNFDYLINKIGRGFITLALKSVQVLTEISVDFGVDTWTFAGARTSAAKVTNHALGRTPIIVLVCGATDQGAIVVAGHAFSYTNTTFTSRGDFTNGSTPTGASNFVWLVIG